MVKIGICDDETEFWICFQTVLIPGAGRISWHCSSTSSQTVTNWSPHTGAYGMDLILLDMIMPFWAAWIPHANCASVTRTFRSFFLTSSPEFALESYEVRTFWYLLKPLDEVRFHAVLDSWCRSPQGFHGSFRSKNRFRLPGDLFSGCRISGSAE